MTKTEWAKAQHVNNEVQRTLLAVMAEYYDAGDPDTLAGSPAIWEARYGAHPTALAQIKSIYGRTPPAATPTQIARALKALNESDLTVKIYDPDRHVWLHRVR